MDLRGYNGKMSVKHHMVSQIDPDHLDERVDSICGALLEQHFPEIRSVRDVTLSRPES